MRASYLLSFIASAAAKYALVVDGGNAGNEQFCIANAEVQVESQVPTDQNPSGTDNWKVIGLQCCDPAWECPDGVTTDSSHPSGAGLCDS